MKTKSKTTNPNGANQYFLDPRQKLCWEEYINVKGLNFANAYQSAISAGYEDSYARTITDTGWFCEKVRKMNFVSKAEGILETILNLPYEITRTNKSGKAIKVIDSSILKVKQDTAKFICERLGKKEGYSNRTEVTGSEGKGFGVPILGLNFQQEIEAL